MCNTFLGLIQCAGREEARRCDIPISRNGTNVIRLSHLLLFCGVNQRLQRCRMENGIQLEEVPTVSHICPGDETSTVPSTTPGEISHQSNICS